MKKSALNKDIFRNIFNSKGRFISIVMIIALGVAFFAGLKKAPKDMKFTADNYYKDYNLFDIRVVSTLGLTDDDLEDIEKISGVEEVRATNYIDVVAKEGENDSVFRVFGYESEDQINGYRLLEGRFPENENECLIEVGMEPNLRYELGSTVKFLNGESELAESLKNTEYTVVGAVQSPYYLSFEKGNSNIGNGKISGYIVVPEENFKNEIYTDIYIKVEGTENVNSYSEDYFELTDKVVEELEKIAPSREKIRYESLINEATEELNKAKNDYDEGKEKSDEELFLAYQKIEVAKKNLEIGKKELDEETRNFNNLIKNGKAEIANVQKELELGYENYNLNVIEFEEATKNAPIEIEQAKKEIEEAKNGVNQLEEALVELEQGIENPYIPEETREKLQEEYNDKSAILSSMLEKLNNGEEDLKIKALELENAKVKLEDAKKTLDDNKIKIDIEEKRLIENEAIGKKELEINRKKLENGRGELEEATEEYNKSKKEVEDKLDDAWIKIEDGEREIKKIERAKWHVLDRKSHYSYVDYEGSADRIDALSKVFPVFFALVAALVCLTSMTRMVDEQRGSIGTLKALGYSNKDIAMKYIIYSLIASIIGSLLGFLIGYTVFPVVIFNAYGLMYMLPPVILSFDLLLSLKITLVAVLLTTITSYIACTKELRENASVLMRPKAPKVGKRILLERIPFIWNKLNFSQKVTLRNIFRYKRRFFMTIFGIGGCTALILAGFGIKDSIRTVVDKQYGELFSYDIAITYEEGKEQIIEDEQGIKDYVVSHEENGSLIKGKQTRDLVIVVPKDKDKFEKYIKLQERGSEEKISIPNKGVIISEQAAKLLSLEIGDEVVIRNKDDYEGVATVAGITENYTFNYVYMSAEYYRDIFMKKADYTKAYGSLINSSREFEDTISKRLMENEGISRVSFNSILRDDFNDVIYSLNYVVLVMIASAGALAFVVLYNLTNVNISERYREIATIKVLGFFDREVSAYIYRENIILTIIGSIVGLFMGIYLHKFIMITVEMENIMFGLDLRKLSYVFAVGLTFIFSIFVNISMHYKLKEIKMVESLKSVD